MISTVIIKINGNEQFKQTSNKRLKFTLVENAERTTSNTFKICVNLYKYQYSTTYVENLRLNLPEECSCCICSSNSDSLEAFDEHCIDEC